MLVLVKIKSTDVIYVRCNDLNTVCLMWSTPFPVSIN